VWAEKAAECARLRGAYQDQQAAGLMTLAELGSKLEELESTRQMAEAEIAALAAQEERVEELERDRDALLEFYAGAVPEALDRLDGEERNRIYRMLRLEAVMNSISNGLGMRNTGTSRKPNRPWNPHFYAIFTQVHNTL
jgi:DNA-binding FadR family transcriptional regulator